ncbi:MAG: response regulator transcription factor [Bacteroidota bacterium]
MKRFLIADDHAIIRYALKNILLTAFVNAHIEEVTDAEDLLKKVVEERWDVVITDISMPGRSGLEILQQIKQIYPKLPVLVLSMHPEELYAVRVIKAGGSGYLRKDTAMHELEKAVNSVLMGKKYITPSIAEQLAHSVENDLSDIPHENLSDRELEILILLASGMSLTEISEKLSLSVTTISTYRTRITKKLNLKTNADLTQYAIAHKII